jgi:hypothetical protein
LKGKVVNCFYDGAGGGLGDFIRGCVYLYSHCKSKGLDFDFDLSKHPINKYISSNCNIEYDVGDIDCLYNKAVEGKTSFLASIKRLTQGVFRYTKDDETKLIFSNFHYYVQSGGKMINAMNSMPPLSKRCCSWFKDNINFNPTVNEAVDKTLFKNKLKIGKFNIVHFRIGDQNSFGDKKNSGNYFKLCNKHCRKILKNTNLPLVILSDSNELKEKLETMSNRVFVFHLESQHTQSIPAESGLDLSISEDGVFYVAFDAKLLTLAKKVYSYSVYTHGSGFVFWLCKIFGIDVKMNLLNVPKSKLPVFFHIPKNAGTYINNRCFSFFKQRFGGKDCYHIDVLKDGVITYRLLCRSSKKLCSDYTSINKICYQINFEDLRLDELDLFLLRVADVGFETYKQDIYSLLPENIKPYEFLCLREPYSRTQSLYSYIQSSQSSHEDTNYKFGNLSFVEYLNSPQLEGSWLIRRFLKIPNEIPITEEHFKKTCDLLSEMLIFGMDDIDESLFKVFMECYGMDCRSITANVYDNKTKEKTKNQDRIFKPNLLGQKTI